MSWHRSKDQKSYLHAKKDEDEEKPWEIVEEQTNDPRLGKRVFCLSLLPTFEVYGTIKRITRYSNKNDLPSRMVEYWRVLNDHGINVETTSERFELYAYDTELKSGDRVRHDLDTYGYWEGVILRPIVAIDHLRFVIRIEKVQTSMKLMRGHEEAHLPSDLVKL